MSIARRIRIAARALLALIATAALAPTGFT
jgi:hypothetical protein